MGEDRSRAQAALRKLVPSSAWPEAAATLRSKALSLGSAAAAGSGRQASKETRRARGEARRVHAVRSNGRLPRAKRQRIMRDCLAKVTRAAVDSMSKPRDGPLDLGDLVGAHVRLLHSDGRIAGAKRRAKVWAVVDVSKNTLVLVSAGNKVTRVQKRGTKFQHANRPNDTFWGDQLL